MTGLEIGYAGALLAGLLSFLSPCVLPLVPPYLCYLGGITFEQLTDEKAAESGVANRVLMAAIAFVLGFTLVFTAMGATASAIGQLLARHMTLLAQIAGVVIIVMGLHFLGLFKIGFLMREARFHSESRPTSLLGAFLVGIAFAFGWTPCVGPALAAILFVAGSEDEIFHGATLLATYALGIGIPFLAAALLVRPFMGLMTRFRRHMQRIEQAMGVLLIITGILFITGGMNDIGFWLLETFPSLGKVG